MTGSFTVTQPKKGQLPRGEQIGDPDTPTLGECVTRDLLEGPGTGRRFDPAYVAWLERTIGRVVAA